MCNMFGHSQFSFLCVFNCVHYDTIFKQIKDNEVSVSSEAKNKSAIWIFKQ